MRRDGPSGQVNPPKKRKYSRVERCCGLQLKVNKMSYLLILTYITIFINLYFVI